MLIALRVFCASTFRKELDVLLGSVTDLMSVYDDVPELMRQHSMYELKACGRIPLDAIVFHVILSEAKDLSSLDSSAKLMADKSAPPQNDMLNEVVCTRTIPSNPYN